MCTVLNNHQGVKICREWMYSSTVLNLGTGWRWVVRFTPRPFYPWGSRVWYQWLYGCVGSRAGLNNVKISKIYSCITFNIISLLKSNVFWDIMPCSLVDVYRRLPYCLHLQGWKVAMRRKELLILRNCFPPKRRLTLNRLCCVISQKTQLFSQTNSSQFKFLTLDVWNRSRATCTLCAPYVCVWMEPLVSYTLPLCPWGLGHSSSLCCAGVQTLVARSHAASRPANNELHLSPQPVITVLLQELLLAAQDVRCWLPSGLCTRWWMLLSWVISRHGQHPAPITVAARSRA
jgi:hypothetical protein